ncbi:uncharacterized protein [Linepithema humile]|uniref:uncharacterized protein n=1 Tax=Linepithema humile TaxID=83485 RepID=UPI000623974D|nr:PREDICTED: uncharacterized protein LOC105679686 [Linepithema humile]
MLSKWFCISLLILIVQDAVANANYIGATIYDMVYYNPNTQLALMAEIEDGRIPFGTSRIGYRGMSCNCNNLTCGCCTGINIMAIKLNNHVCTNFTYHPEDFAISAKFIMNERVILNRNLSAKNPPPFCLPFSVPFVSFCVRFYDIYTSGKNLHTCVDFETHVVMWPILTLHFDCVKIGTDGVSWMKPQNGSNVLQTSTTEVSAPEVYDEVAFETESVPLGSIQMSTVTPEEEASIGQLKL